MWTFPPGKQTDQRHVVAGGGTTAPRSKGSAPSLLCLVPQPAKDSTQEKRTALRSKVVSNREEVTSR